MSHLGHSGETEAHIGKEMYVSSLRGNALPGRSGCKGLLFASMSLSTQGLELCRVPWVSPVGLSPAHSDRTRGVLPILRSPPGRLPQLGATTGEGRGGQ